MQATETIVHPHGSGTTSSGTADGFPADPTLCTAHPGILLPVKAFILCVHYIITLSGAFVNRYLRNFCPADGFMRCPQADGGGEIQTVRLDWKEEK